MMTIKNHTALLLCALTLGLGCAGSTDDPTATGPGGPGGSRGVGMGGPQDIARFRSIVEAGDVPAPNTLDPIGFLAEHAFDLPPAECGEAVCVHPFLAVAPRFDGSNWTMAFVALNSSVDPSTLERPPIHVALVLEDSTRMPFTQADLVAALRELVFALRPEDRVSIVRVGRTAQTLVDTALTTDPAIGAAVRALGSSSEGTAATYDGLAEAARVLEGFEGQRRVVLLTSGRADAGVRSEERTVTLARSMAASGISLSIVGAAQESMFADRLPLALGELGAGAYYFAEDASALTEILRLEGQTALFPIATDFTLRIEAAPGYRIGRVVGARTSAIDERVVTISSPVLLLGQREGATDVDSGRRGGGGGVFVELIADGSSGISAGRAAFSATAIYTDAAARPVELSQLTLNALAPGANPEGMWPSFSDEERGKPFMSLNMYLALRAAVDFYDAGDCARAMGIAELMRRSVEGWQARSADPDIDADWNLLLDLTQNVQESCTSSEPVAPVPPRDFSGGCMMI